MQRNDERKEQLGKIGSIENIVLASVSDERKTILVQLKNLVS